MKKIIKKIKSNVYKLFFLKQKNIKYIKSPARDIFSVSIIEDLVLIVVAFNFEDLIKTQYFLLLKYFEDRFDYVVCDNSSDEKESNKIKNFCIKEKIYYIKLPKNKAPDSSLSHGLALNWVFYNFILKIKPKYFGLLDHDIFPIKKGDILSIIKNKNYYGIKNGSDKKWYIWPGFAFFNRKFYIDKKMNFLPKRPLDTGGMNSKIYMKQPEKSFISRNVQYIKNIGNVDFFHNVFHLMGENNIENNNLEAINKKKDFLREVISSLEK